MERSWGKQQEKARGGGTEQGAGAKETAEQGQKMKRRAGEGKREKMDSEGKQQAAAGQENYNIDIQDIEIEAAIKSFENGKGVGADSIPHEVLKAGGKTVVEILGRLFRRCWRLGYLPKLWKEARVRPLVKPGAKRDNLRVSDLRPISLCVTTIKILERIVCERLSAYLEGARYFHRYQSGFRKKFGTLDGISALALYLDGAVSEQGNAVVAVFLDIKRAFDTVNPERLLDVFANAGITGRMYGFLRSYLTDRSFRVYIENQKSELVNSSIGVPQGGCLSALAFAVFVNSIFEDSVFGYDEPGQNLLGLYADDASFAVTIPKDTPAEEVVGWINRRIEAVRSWCVSNRQLVSAEKTKAMIFTADKSRKEQLAQALSEIEIWPGNKLIFCDEFRFLGVVFSARLSWEAQVAASVRKANLALKRLREVCGNIGRDTDIATRRNLVNTVVLSHLLNCSVIWSDCRARSEAFVACARVYNNATRWVLNAGSLWIQSNSEVEVETNLEPLKLFWAKHTISQVAAIVRKDTPASQMLKARWNHQGLIQDKFRGCCELLGLRELMHLNTLELQERKLLKAALGNAVATKWQEEWAQRNRGVDCTPSPLQGLLPDMKLLTSEQWKVNGLRSSKQDRLRALLRLSPQRVEIRNCACAVGLSCVWRDHLFFECEQLSGQRELLRRCLEEDEQLRSLREVNSSDDLRDIVSLQTLLGVGKKSSEAVLKKLRGYVNEFLSCDKIFLVENNIWFVKEKEFNQIN